MTKDLSTLTRNYIQRKATPEQIQSLFDNQSNINQILELKDGITPTLRGQAIEFIRQEFLSQNGWILYDKHGKKEKDDFHYAGGDRADIRAVWQDENNPNNRQNPDDLEIPDEKLVNLSKHR